MKAVHSAEKKRHQPKQKEAKHTKEVVSTHSIDPSSKVTSQKEINPISDNPYKKVYNKNHRKPPEECYASWTALTPASMYYSFTTNSYLQVVSEGELPDNTVIDIDPSKSNHDVAFVAVTKDVPKTFQEALKHPIWGTPARTEWMQFTETNAVVEVDPEMAYQEIRNKTAQLVILFPVYESKIKDGKEVLKVRLVGDGSRQQTLENTFAATPSREELLLLLQIAASLGWKLVHLDEIRAFLNAKKKSQEKIFAKFRKDSKIYLVINALYGLKGSPRDYQLTVRERLISMGFTNLISSQCLYIYQENEEMIVIYVYVDDFIVTGTDEDTLDHIVQQTRIQASTTSPIIDPPAILGMEIKRNKDTKTIEITMKKKISSLANSLDITTVDFSTQLPIPARGYVIKVEDLPCKNDQESLSMDEKSEYLRIVGSLIWISGVRPDILFAVMYLSWWTKTPTNHHKRMAYHLVQYLFNTLDLPLILGGDLSEDGIQIEVYTDASLGTAPKGKSIIAHLVKIQHQAASIITKVKATTNVYLSSFESELDGYIAASRSMQRVRNILDELRLNMKPIADVYCDNKALVDFIKGYGEPKGLKHIALRLFAAREEYSWGNINLQHMPGTNIPADPLTKVKDLETFEDFRSLVLGHELWHKTQN